MLCLLIFHDIKAERMEKFFLFDQKLFQHGLIQYILTIFFDFF
jgi:hypothetical protein